MCIARSKEQERTTSAILRTISRIDYYTILAVHIYLLPIVAASCRLVDPADACIRTDKAMPRHRVRLEDRKRSVRACEACRLSRKRCDSRLPCSSCSRKGIGASCVYGDRAKQSPPNRIGSSRDREGLPIHHEPRSEDAPQPLLAQNARMLLTAKGEKGEKGNQQRRLCWLSLLRQFTWARPLQYRCSSFSGMSFDDMQDLQLSLKADGVIRCWRPL